MLDLPDLDSPDPLKRDLACLRLLEELLGPEWVERGGLWSVGGWRRCGSGVRRRGTP